MKMISVNEQAWRKLPGYRKNVLLAGEDMNCEGPRVQLVTIDPGDIIQKHYHKTSYEVYYVLRGACQLIANSEITVLEVGSMLVMEPGDVHKLYNQGTEAFELLVFKTNAGNADTYWST